MYNIFYNFSWFLTLIFVLNIETKTILKETNFTIRDALLPNWLTLSNAIIINKNARPKVIVTIRDIGEKGKNIETWSIRSRQYFNVPIIEIGNGSKFYFFLYNREVWSILACKEKKNPSSKPSLSFTVKFREKTHVFTHTWISICTRCIYIPAKYTWKDESSYHSYI